MIHFLVQGKELNIDEKNTILQVKQQIIDLFQLSCSYIDIDFVIERPMRVLGKFNVEPGKVPRALDTRPLDAFAFKGSVELRYTEITDYEPKKLKKFISGGGKSKDSSSNKERPSLFNHKSLVQDMNIDPIFVLDSEVDFPSLGK